MCIERPFQFCFFILFPALSLCNKNPVVRKQFPTGGRITAVAYDRRKRILYTVSQDRYLYALSETYLLKWRLWLKDPSISSLTVGPDHTIYTGTEYNKLIAVNPSGRIIWELKLDGKPVGNVVCDPDGTLYTVTGAGSLYAVSHTGMIRYRIQLPSKPVLSPVMNDRYIFVACRDNRLYAYDRWGTQKWIFLFSGIPLSVVCSDSYIYAGTGTGTVVAVDMEGRKNGIPFSIIPYHPLFCFQRILFSAAHQVLLFLLTHQAKSDGFLKEGES